MPFKTAAAPLSALCLATSAAADPGPGPGPTPDPSTEVVREVDLATLQRIVGLTGWDTRFAVMEGDVPTVEFQPVEGLVGLVRGMNCDADGRSCKSFVVGTFWERAPLLDPARVEAFDRAAPSVSLNYTEDGSAVVLERWVYVGEGQTLANLALNVYMTMQDATDFVAFLREDAVSR